MHFVFKLSSALDTGVLLFSGDDTRTDCSIGIELCKGEPHIKSNSQYINDHCSLLNDYHCLLSILEISVREDSVAIRPNMPNS